MSKPELLPDGWLAIKEAVGPRPEPPPDPVKREKGWYWVKDWGSAGGLWIIAMWSGNLWYDIDSDGGNSDLGYAEIGERIPDHQ